VLDFYKEQQLQQQVQMHAIHAIDHLPVLIQYLSLTSDHVLHVFQMYLNSISTVFIHNLVEQLQ